MKFSRRNWFFVPAILFMLLFAVSAVPPSVHATTNQKDLSACISNGFSIVYDSTNSLAYVAEGISTNKIAKIDLSTVMTGGCASVTSFSSIFPVSSGSVGNFAGGPFGLVLQGGNLWATATYNNGIGVSEVSTSGTVAGTWYHATTGGASTGQMVGDGSKLYASMPDQAILVFDPSTDAFSTISTNSHAVAGLYLSGSTLDFTTQDTVGYGSVTTSGGSLTLGSLGNSANFVTQDGSGNLWITSNTSHKLYEVVSGVVSTFSTGMTSDGPYGIAVPSCSPLSGEVYVWGYANLNLAQFTISNSSIKDVATFTDKPYTGFVDSSCTLWGFALGSMVFFHLSLSASASTQANVCNPVTSHATPTDPATAAFNRTGDIVTTSANVTIPFYISHQDALPASFAVACHLVIDSASFDSLTVTSLTYSIDGAPAVSIWPLVCQPDVPCVSPLTHLRGLLSCDGKVISNFSRWPSCKGSFNSVQVWEGSLSLSLPPILNYNQPHIVTLEAWGQNGSRSTFATIRIYNGLYTFGGPSFALQFPASDVGHYEQVNATGLLSDRTAQGILMQSVFVPYIVKVPVGGLVYGEFLPYGKLSVTGGSVVNQFTIGSDYSVTQNFVVR